MRIGGAGNPGPAAVSLATLAYAAHYHRSTMGEFDNAKCRRMTSGAHGNLDNRKDQYCLTAATANSTCWNSAKQYLGRAKAEVVLLQEH